VKKFKKERTKKRKEGKKRGKEKKSNVGLFIRHCS
jgi:hypothetical protein